MGSRYNDKKREDVGRHDSGMDSYPQYPGARRPKKKKNGGSVISTILLAAAICVFAFSAYKLIGYYREYKKGQDEYSSLEDTYTVKNPTAPVEAASEASSEDGGYILTNVEQLEDPDTVEEVKAGAKTRQITEGPNGNSGAGFSGGETNAAGADSTSGTAAGTDPAGSGAVETVPMLVNPIDFDELAKVNTEVMGWLRIGALDISYPVAQAADNEYYLHRTFRREEVFSGCIFLNCDNTKYLTDQNSIVYGHNMKDGSMFGRLKELDQEHYNENPYFWIFTPNLIYQYRIFSTSTVSRAGDPYRTRFSRDDFQAFINNSQEQSGIDSHGVTVTTDDRIVTLSTCTGNDETRFIVQGRLEQIYASVKSADANFS